MTEDRTFYVYVGAHPETGEPAYVGKGRGKRMNTHNAAARAGSHENSLLMATIRKYGPMTFVKVQIDMTELEAFALERELIAKYGRRNMGTGTLCNLTDGGEGTSGMSAEARAARGLKTRGQKRSKAACRRMRRAHLGKKRSPEHVAAIKAGLAKSTRIEARNAKLVAAQLAKRWEKGFLFNINDRRVNKGKRKKPARRLRVLLAPALYPQLELSL